MLDFKEEKEWVEKNINLDYFTLSSIFLDNMLEAINDSKITMEKASKLILSEDYKERFKGETYELVIRIAKLSAFLMKIFEAYKFDKEIPQHDCPVEILYKQLGKMTEYLDVLADRKELENIDLELELK